MLVSITVQQVPKYSNAEEGNVMQGRRKQFGQPDHVRPDQICFADKFACCLPDLEMTLSLSFVCEIVCMYVFDLWRCAYVNVCMYVRGDVYAYVCVFVFVRDRAREYM